MHTTIFVLGFFSNLLILTVWSTESMFIPTVYGFKCLAVSDLVATGFFLIRQFTVAVGMKKSSLLYVLVHGLVAANINLGSLVILMLVNIRVIVVLCSYRTRGRLLSCRRLHKIMATFVTVCLAMEFFFDILNYLSSLTENTAICRSWNKVLNPFVLVEHLVFIQFSSFITILLHAAVIAKVNSMEWHDITCF